MSKEELIIPDINPDDLNSAEPGPVIEAPQSQGLEQDSIKLNPDLTRSEATIDQIEEAIANLDKADKKEK